MPQIWPYTMATDSKAAGKRRALAKPRPQGHHPVGGSHWPCRPGLFIKPQHPIGWSTRLEAEPQSQAFLSCRIRGAKQGLPALLSPHPPAPAAISCCPAQFLVLLSTFSLELLGGGRGNSLGTQCKSSGRGIPRGNRLPSTSSGGSTRGGTAEGDRCVLAPPSMWGGGDVVSAMRDWVSYRRPCVCP